MPKYCLPLLKEVADEAKNTGAQPGLLSNPELDLLQVGRQDVGGKVGDKALGKGLKLGLGGQSSGVSVSGVETVQALVSPTLGLPPGVLCQLFQISGETLSGDGLLDHLEEQGAPGNQGSVVSLALRKVNLDSIVVALEDDFEHLCSLYVVGVDQSSTDLLNSREEVGDDLIHRLTVLNLEPKLETNMGSVL